MRNRNQGVRVGAKGTVGENKEPEVILTFYDLIDCVNESVLVTRTQCEEKVIQEGWVHRCL